MWTEVAPVIMEKTRPRNHSLLSFTMSIAMKRRLSLLQAQVRRMAVSSSGLEQLVKSFQRIGKAIFRHGHIFSFHTVIFFYLQSTKNCQICTQVLEIGREMLTCQVAQKSSVLKKWNFKKIWDMVFVLQIPKGFSWVTCVCLLKCVIKSMFC